MSEVPWLNNYLEKRESFSNSVFVEGSFKKAQEVKAIDTIKMEDFADLYDIETDKKYVESKEKIFAEKDTDREKENKKIATILEAILHQQIEQNDYLGSGVCTISTCKYDDIKNGIDGILEMEDEKSRTADHLAVAIDATFNADIHRKIDRIKKEINQGELAKIKYFKSDFLDFRGEKGNIPKFVIGIDKSHLEEITKIWVNNPPSSLANHPVQIVIFDELLIQTKYFRDYAKSIGKKKVAKKYNDLYNIFQKIKIEKELEWNKILEKPKNQDIIDNDRVYQSIKRLEY